MPTLSWAENANKCKTISRYLPLKIANEQGTVREGKGWLAPPAIAPSSGPHHPHGSTGRTGWDTRCLLPGQAPAPVRGGKRRHFSVRLLSGGFRWDWLLSFAVRQLVRIPLLSLPSIRHKGWQGQVETRGCRFWFLKITFKLSHSPVMIL